MILDKLFDRIYIINRATQVDRYKNCLMQLNRHAITNFEFVTAHDGAHEAQVKKLYTKLRESQKNEPGSIQNPYELACLMSHLKVYRLAKKANHQKILVLEDDFILCHEFIPKSTHLIPSLPHWDLLYLGAVDYNFLEAYDRDLRKNPNQGYYCSQGVLSAFAYGITRKSMNILLKKLSHPDYLNTVFDYHLRDLASQIDTLVCWPPLAIADVRTSDLRSSRDIFNFARNNYWLTKDFPID